MHFCIASLLMAISISENTLDSRTVLALRIEAKAQTSRGQWSLAQSTYRKAIQLASDPAEKLDTQVDLMFLQLRLADQSAARTILDAIQAQQPKLPHSMVKYRALASIGVAYWQLGEARLAIDPVSEALSGLPEFLPPDQLDAYRLTLANIHLELKAYGKSSESLASIQTPVARGSAHFHYVSAMIQMALKHYETAETRFQNAFSAPNFPQLAPGEKATIYLGYSSLLSKLNRKTQAKEFHLKVQELVNQTETLTGSRHKIAWQGLR